MTKKLRKPVPSKGDWVRIRFHDHVEGSDDVAEYYVSGRVAKVTQQAYTVDSWAAVDPNQDRDGNRENITTNTILRGVITEVVIHDDPDASPKEKS